MVPKKTKTVVDPMFSQEEYEIILELLVQISERMKENKKKAKLKVNNTDPNPTPTVLEKASSGDVSITPSKKKTKDKSVAPEDSQVLSQSVAKKLIMQELLTTHVILSEKPHLEERLELFLKYKLEYQFTKETIKKLIPDHLKPPKGTKANFIRILATEVEFTPTVKDFHRVIKEVSPTIQMLDRGEFYEEGRKEKAKIFHGSAGDRLQKLKTCLEQCLEIFRTHQPGPESARFISKMICDIMGVPLPWKVETVLESVRNDRTDTYLQVYLCPLMDKIGKSDGSKTGELLSLVENIAMTALDENLDHSKFNQIFIDAIWYCRLFCGKTVGTNCTEESTKKNELPTLVSDDELLLLINIQLVALVSCGVNLTHIKFAGDRVGIAMDLLENINHLPKINTWVIKEQTAREIIPMNCKIYLVKHTAFYFHKFKLLDKLVLGPLDYKENSSGLRSTNTRGQLPDSEWSKAFGRFIFEEISILKSFYSPDDQTFEQRVFQKFKSISPLHLLVPYKSFSELSSSNNIVYGNFNSQRQVSTRLVSKNVNPYLKKTVVQETKKLLKSGLNHEINRLMPEPKIVANRKERQSNPRIEATLPSTVKENWFDSMFVREQKILAYSIGFQKIRKRMQRNSKLIFGGKSGVYISKLFEAKGFDQDQKGLLLFIDPRKPTISKSKISLANIQVAACRSVMEYGNIYQIQPLATVVGQNKTTSLNSPVPKIIQSFKDILETNTVVIFNMVKQQLGIFKIKKDVLLNLSNCLDLLPSCFQMDEWAPHNGFQNFDHYMNSTKVVLKTPPKPIWNYSKSNFSYLSTKLLSESVQCIDQAAIYHSHKRPMKTYSKPSSEIKITVVGKVRLNTDHLFLDVQISDQKVVSLNLSW